MDYFIQLSNGAWFDAALICAGFFIVCLFLMVALPD